MDSTSALGAASRETDERFFESAFREYKDARIEHSTIERLKQHQVPLAF